MAMDMLVRELRIFWQKNSKSAAMHRMAVLLKVCYLSVVSGRQRDSLSAKAYIR